MPVLHGVDFHANAGEVVAVLGRNGVGKTTLAKTMMGVLPAMAGRVNALGEDVTGWKPYERARLGIAYAPQDLPIFDQLTVDQNLVLASRDRSTKDETREAAFDAFPVLRNRLAQRAGTLSGGERKMLLMARAVVQRPDLLILDEVTEGVQPAIIDIIGRTIEREVTRGASVVLIEQRLDFALKFASKFVLMHAGEIAAQGDVTADTSAVVAKHMVLR